MKQFQQILLSHRLIWGVCVFAPLAQADGLLAVDNPAKNGGATGAYISADAFQGNDSIAIRQYGAAWQGDYSPRSGINIGLLAARAEAGAQWNGFRLGALYRAQALVETNRDTTDLAKQYNSSTGYDTGRTYLIDYRITGFEAIGARLSKSYEARLNDNWNMGWGAGAALLHGKQLKVATATGQVTTLNAKDFNANVTLSSMDSALDTSGDGDFNPPYGAHPALSGQGFALDLGVVFRRQDGLRLEAAVNDLAASMTWKNLPEYAPNYNTATKYFDAEGYVHFNPSATAQSSYRNLIQILDPKVWLAVGYPFGAFEVQAATSYTSGYWFPEVGVAYRVNPQWRVNLDYDVRFKTVGIAVRHQYLNLSLRTDDFNLDHAKAYGFGAGINIPF